MTAAALAAVATRRHRPLQPAPLAVALPTAPRAALPGATARIWATLCTGAVRSAPGGTALVHKVSPRGRVAGLEAVVSH
ncbi:hypothetical protein [Kribbella kalugense]|uniref:hypothetical protein n=1 Tax=Kribbella kalugense TaxID=2512221 RepID=UPI00106663D7|nr:hypothetical protein [Kribbella kalugense]